MTEPTPPPERPLPDRPAPGSVPSCSPTRHENRSAEPRWAGPARGRGRRRAGGRPRLLGDQPGLRRRRRRSSGRRHDARRTPTAPHSTMPTSPSAAGGGGHGRPVHRELAQTCFRAPQPAFDFPPATTAARRRSSSRATGSSSATSGTASRRSCSSRCRCARRTAIATTYAVSSLYLRHQDGFRTSGSAAASCRPGCADFDVAYTFPDGHTEHADDGDGRAGAHLVADGLHLRRRWRQRAGQDADRGDGVVLRRAAALHAGLGHLHLRPGQPRLLRRQSPRSSASCSTSVA